jgi:multicomponent Na+:H+ antiporter subunit C
MENLQQIIVANFNYWVYVALMMIGLFAMISKNNLIKKLIGMSIFQTAIILFYVSLSVKGTTDNVSIPIVHHHEPAADAKAEHEDGSQGHDDSAATDHHGSHAVNSAQYANPLPHVLMLTAIVVGVATLGVALAVSQLLYKDYGTLEEDEILTTVRDMPPDHG